MKENPVIPLFPLSLVVFPGERRPLHIFEERYKTMIAHCRASEAREEDHAFGISLMQDGNLCSVGCSVEIAEITHEYPDGRLDILTMGKQRFKIQEVYQDQSYLRAAVEFFEDRDESVDALLVQDATERLRRLLELVGEQVEVEERGSDLPYSFVLAQRAELDLKLKQSLLEMTGENQRLQRLIEYFDRLIPALRQYRERVEQAQSNGHPKIP